MRALRTRRRTLAAPRPRRALYGSAALVLMGAAAGGALLAWHAIRLGEASGSTASSADEGRVARLFQPLVPGAVFAVPDGGAPGVRILPQPSGTVLVAHGLRPDPVVRVDLCTQLSGNRLVPLRIGYRFGDVERWQRGAEEKGAPLGLRNVLLLSDSSASAMPELELAGVAGQLAPLSLRWKARPESGSVQWLGDSGAAEPGRAAMLRQGWLAWQGAALRLERRRSGACPQAGELVVQMYRPSERSMASLVAAFSPHGEAASALLRPGRYEVPSRAPASLEDKSLFDALQAHGLVRISANGLAELAPQDLPAWRASSGEARVPGLDGWQGAVLDDEGRKLLKRLYQQADGDYVRQQADIYNSERQLLAWRLKDGSDAVFSAAGAAGPLPQTAAMPASSARLFDSLPHGWQPWSRVARWPSAAGDGATLTLSLPQAASGKETLRMLLIGRVGAAHGAAVSTQPACTGRACGSAGDVQALVLNPHPGVREITLSVAPLDAAGMLRPEDYRYRHLVNAGGRLIWQALPDTLRQPAAASPAAVPVLLHDRNGTLLWSAGAPTRQAQDAGLSAMLGLNEEHANSIAGMLARAGMNAGGSSSAQLTIDLPLQALSQQILDCLAMRRGRWTGTACTGGSAPPEGRHAGFVLLDAENGDILAAAGAGSGRASAASWAELRDFDRANPARSPLRLPALQHDGGAHQSPGSTFKVVSALGLEMAARSDRQLDSLLDGLPLARINAVARGRGFAFDTAAPIYPATAKQVHITNYREQSLDRRAQEGRLGLAQALTYSLNTWFAWSAELSDRSLFGQPTGGVPAVQPLEAGALEEVRPIVAAARLLGFEQPLRLDAGLLPPDFAWSAYDALQGTPAHFDPIHSRHELRQMSIGLRMQSTPLQMALASAAIGEGATVTPRLLLTLNGRQAETGTGTRLPVRLDRIRAGMKGVVDRGTAAGAFGGPALAALRPGLYGKTGTAPVTEQAATVWFTGWLEPGMLPGQRHRLAFAAFASHSDASGGEHAAPVVAAVLAALARQNGEQRGK
ncbi:penicillin-binding transpeptidase domain-containing protein [Massilia endophytica]|uniref:penicillin-binding transpeptidase domain-containing protein n=1 Tax=Massilia endophytica TaxID=2899220 RepID=UPI001E596B5F|nr:penicillin-binding transpeptidase domain-containing protein [Massilia endophytica]UGQ48305.1 hypothetical protein LSQ66_07520 [Massilia endophytica]